MPKLEKIIEYGFYLFVFLLPWQTRWIYKPGVLNNGFWEYGTFSLYGIEILLWLILVSFFIWLIKSQGLRFKKIQEYNLSKLIILLLIYLLLFSTLATIFWAQDARLAYHIWFRLLEAMSLMLLILNFNLSFVRISLAIVASASIQGVLAIWQFLSQSTFANKWLGLALQQASVNGVSVVQDISERWLRAYGSLPHPNILAGWLVVGLILLVGLSFVAQKRFQRIFILTNLIILVPALFFTFSRAAWLGLLLGLLFLVFYLARPVSRASEIYGAKTRQPVLRNLLVKIILINIIIFAVLAINLKEPLLARFAGEYRLEEKSTQERLLYRQQAKEIIAKNWHKGVGIGNYTLAVHHLINPNLEAWDYQPVHNIYLLVLAELGIMGFIFFILLSAFTILLSLIRGFKDNWHLIYFTSFLSLLIIGFFDHYLWSLYFGVVLFWLILALTVKSVKFG